MKSNLKDKESEIQIRSLKESDYPVIKELCDRRFGEGYLDYDTFLRLVSFPDFNLVADEGGKPVAMVGMIPEQPEVLAESMQISLEELLRDANGKPMIHCKTGVCDENHERRGLVTRLLKKAVENARNLGYGVMVSADWMYDGKTPGEKSQFNCGFVPIGIRHNIWYNQKNYHCLVCKGPCRCDAKITKLIL